MTSISPNAPIVYLRNPNPGNYNYSIDNVTWYPVVLPLTISNPNAPSLMKVVFTTDFTMTSTSHYFVCGSESIQFGDETLNPGGVRPVITIESVTDYPGLIQNGSDFTSPGYSYFYVMNLMVSSSGSTLVEGGGWVCQRFFSVASANNYVLNCSSDGDISHFSGGIIGRDSAYNFGEMIVVGCSSTGSIGNGSGGIIGTGCADTNGFINVYECFSTGTIDQYGGGIVSAIGTNGGNATIIKCYSTGTIGQYAGGIAGHLVGASGGIVGIDSCYSTGTIGQAAGGIVGYNAGSFVGGVVVTNSYSTGTLGTDAGGIIGDNYVGSVVAINCYTSGGGLGQGIYSGVVSDGPNNYSERNNGSSGWTSSHAQGYLQNIGTTSWIEVTPNTPYELINFGPSPYTLSPINFGIQLSLTHSYSQTVQPGNSGDPSVYPVYTSYSIVQSSEPSITIDSSTGVLSTTTSTPPGVYTLLIRASYNPYTITTFVLTVTGGPSPPTPTPVPEFIPQQNTIPHMWQNIKLPNGPKDVACNTAARCHPTHVYKNVPEPVIQPANPGQQRICNLSPPAKQYGSALQQYRPGYGTYTVTYNKPSGSRVASTWPPPSNK
jgi:hypothetical protein